jgi:hypothetical protein
MSAPTPPGLPHALGSGVLPSGPAGVLVPMHGAGRYPLSAGYSSQAHCATLQSAFDSPAARRRQTKVATVLFPALVHGKG